MNDTQLNLNSLNFSIRSFISINDLIFPIIIHMSDIKDEVNNIEEYKVDFISNQNDEFKYSVDQTEHPFKENIELAKIKQRIKYVHQFIDFDMSEYDGTTISDAMKILYDYNIKNIDEFNEFILSLNSGALDDITKATYEINFYICRMKNRFIDTAKKILDWDRNFPYLKSPMDSMDINESLKIPGMYPYGMIELQSVAEYPMSIWFDENIGKGFNEWSWREKELKKMYITMKVKIENYKDNLTQYIQQLYFDKNNGNKGKR